VALALLPPTASSNRPMLAATAVLGIAGLMATLGVPWARVPAWCQTFVPRGFFVVVVLLRDLVTAMGAELRIGDVIARLGGDEFALVLPGCDLQQARILASRLLRVVPSGQTTSIGLTQAGTHDTPRALGERADRALYAAKGGGRNQVKTSQTPPLTLSALPATPEALPESTVRS
jgi:hypothetical protein